MRLEVRDITKCYGRKKALDNFSLSLTNGVYGLLGPNGAGKSTLIGIITGLINADSGSVEFISKEKQSLNETLGFLPQYQNFYGNFTAEEMLKYIMCLKKYKPDNADRYIGELLEMVNLSDSRNKKIRTFSGGMKQRLGIAQALAGDPKIIIFDEPTAGLDPKERIRFRNLVSSLGKDKIVILATHIVTDIEYIAKEVVLIREGRLLYFAPQEIITNSISDKVWEYLCSGEDIIEIMKNHKVSNAAPCGSSFRLRIISEIKPFDSAVPTTPDLDDVCLYHFGEM